MNSSGFTFTKFLSGAYKTLTIANQVLPLYRQVGPMIKNARSAFSIISEINRSNKTSNKKVVKNDQNKVNQQKKELPLNNPVFFQ